RLYCFNCKNIKNIKINKGLEDFLNNKIDDKVFSELLKSLINDKQQKCDFCKEKLFIFNYNSSNHVFVYGNSTKTISNYQIYNIVINTPSIIIKLLFGNFHPKDLFFEKNIYIMSNYVRQPDININSNTESEPYYSRLS